MILKSVRRFWGMAFLERIKKSIQAFSFKHGHGLRVIFNQKEPSPANSCFDELDSSIFESLYYSIRESNLFLNKEIDELKKRNAFLSDQNSKYQKDEINLLAELKDQKFLSDTLSEEISENETELSSLKESLAKTNQENLLLIDKVNRTTNSFSWKISAPLRFLRRKLIDPIFRSKNSFDAQKLSSPESRFGRSFWARSRGCGKTLQGVGKERGASIFGSRPSKKNHISAMGKGVRYCRYSIPKKFDEEFKSLSISPLISIIIPVFNISPKIFLETLKSVKSQIYQNWELVIVDDCSTRQDLIENLNNIEKSDKRIRLTFRKQNGHISRSLKFWVTNS